MPTFSWPPERLVLLIAGGNKAMVRAVEGAEDEIEDAIALVSHHGVGSNDVLIAVAASGTTPFTLACLREAKRRGALTVGMTNNSGTPLLEEAEHPILLQTGAEPIAGSTRMNAGTAQRIALNLLSSLLMIRLGRVYKGLMVDVQASNAKLAARRESILFTITGRSRDEVRAALERTNGSVKLAALLLEGCDLERAKTALESVGGRLRAAMALVAQERCQTSPPRERSA
jgi:N-acetylmuramic acid 6-phosphate etherase